MNELPAAAAGTPTELAGPPKADSPLSWMLGDFHPLMPPRARAATAAFVADFEELLAHAAAHPAEKWVAYYGSERIGFGTSHLKLLDDCEARFSDGEFDVFPIDPVLQYPNDTVV